MAVLSARIKFPLPLMAVAVALLCIYGDQQMVGGHLQEAAAADKEPMRRRSAPENTAAMKEAFKMNDGDQSAISKTRREELRRLRTRQTSSAGSVSVEFPAVDIISFDPVSADTASADSVLVGTMSANAGFGESVSVDYMDPDSMSPDFMSAVSADSMFAASAPLDAAAAAAIATAAAGNEQLVEAELIMTAELLSDFLEDDAMRYNGSSSSKATLTQPLSGCVTWTVTTMWAMASLLV